MSGITFEAGMEELEKLVTQMERGEMPLDQSIAAYSRGMELIKELNAMLDAGDKRILELLSANETCDISREVLSE